MASAFENRLRRTIEMAGTDGQTGPVPVTAIPSESGNTLGGVVATSAAGAQYSIAVTATTVSMTVGGVTISRTNSSTRGPYLYLGCENGATTMSVSFSDLAVTPT